MLDEGNAPQQQHAEIILGIDLGTTNSEVAVLHKGKVKVLTIEGSKLVPSVVSLDANGTVLIGTSAVNNALAAPTHTIHRIKRKMGQEEVVMLGDNNFTPPMISSLILKKLKLAAENFMGQKISKAIITVPAFFNEQQREATKEAAELAGLEAVRLLNEPTAAALAYSFGNQGDECCLIYDLGGGTFDVSIVHLSKNLMEVKASHGDTELGGGDFDRLIAEKVRKAFMTEHEIDLAKDPLAWTRVMRAAEEAKIRLSTEASARILEEFISNDKGSPLHLNFNISRTEFEAMIRPMLEQTLVSVRTALMMAGVTTAKLKRVILVGGATYTPLVSQMLEEELQIAPQRGLDPSLVVAMGAAIEAANLSGQPIGPMMVDVTPHSIGVGCCDDDGYLFNHILIRRNTPLPCTASRVFYKSHEDQKQARIRVYQGESSEINHSQMLGEFLVEDIESKGADICIKYHLDRSGMLHVTTTDIASGKKGSQVVKRAAGARVRAANLADLESVQLQTVEVCNAHLSEEDEEFWQAMQIVPDSDDATQDVLSKEDQEMIQRSEALLADGHLDAVDAQEISVELDLAKKGHRDAFSRLVDLTYYLE